MIQLTKDNVRVGLKVIASARFSHGYFQHEGTIGEITHLRNGKGEVFNVDVIWTNRYDDCYYYKDLLIAEDIVSTYEIF